MGDFLLRNYQHLTLGVELLAAVTGIILFKKYRHTAAKYFIYFLIYVVIMVVIARYSYLVQNDGILSFLKGTLLERNYWWNTIFWSIVAVVFFGWYYLKILKNILYKKALKIALIIFIVFSVFSILITLPKFFITTLPTVKVLGGFVIILCVFFYFMEILKSDNILTFHRSLNFYISCSILLFWLIKTPLVFFEQYYRTTDMSYIALRGYINLIAISYMYIMYTIGLIVSNPEYD